MAGRVIRPRKSTAIRIADSLHNTRFSFTVDADTTPFPFKVQTIDIPAALSQTFGKNLNTCATYKLVGYAATIGLPDLTNEIPETGGRALVTADIHYVVPTSARIRALKHMYEEWVAEHREQAGRARSRAFRPGYSLQYAFSPWQSFVTRGGINEPVALLRQGAAAAPGTGVGVFDEYNERNPVYPEPTHSAGAGIDTLVERQDRMYENYASTVEDALPVQIAYSIGDRRYWDGTTEQSQISENIHTESYQCWAPAGTYWPVMCGQMEFVIRAVDEFPALSNKGLQFYVDFWISGWKEYV